MKLPDSDRVATPEQTPFTENTKEKQKATKYQT